MGESESSGGAAKSPWGSVQGLIALGIGYGLTRLVSWGWPRFFHQPAPDWVKGVVPQVAGAVLALGLFIGAKIFLAWRTRKSRQTAAAKGDRLTIYIAKLGEDSESESARQAVIRSIRAELPREVVEVIPAGVRYELTEGVSEDVAAAEPAKKARELLKKKHGDLLIWGRVHHVGGKAQIELRFVSGEADAALAESSVYGVSEKLTLDADFGPEMGTALAAVIGTQAGPAVTNSGTYLADVLRPVAMRMQTLAEHLPTSMKGSDRGQILFAYGLLQSTIGEQKGEESRLRLAIAAFREALKEHQRERVPRHWAMTQNNLGGALLKLGEGERGTEHLEEAVVAYREALKECAPDRRPLDWALTQNNLAGALLRLGERETGTQRLKEAAEVYREALKVWTRDRAPLDWAMTQNNLAGALLRLGEREVGTERLKEAVEVYREALKERKRERVPLDWAMTQNNLGTALSSLGERESGTKRLEEAVEAYREALKERTRKRVPLDWATTQNNLGTALRGLGERKKDTKLLDEAVAAYREALKERTQNRVALQWATTQNNLGTALRYLGESEDGTKRLEEAVDAYREALKERTRDNVLLLWAVTQNNLGNALRSLGERKSDIEQLKEARKAMENALEVFRDAPAPHYEALTRENLALLDEVLARQRVGPE